MTTISSINIITINISHVQLCSSERRTVCTPGPLSLNTEVFRLGNVPTVELPLSTAGFFVSWPGLALSVKAVTAIAEVMKRNTCGKNNHLAERIIDGWMDGWMD